MKPTKFLQLKDEQIQSDPSRCETDASVMHQRSEASNKSLQEEEEEEEEGGGGEGLLTRLAGSGRGGGGRGGAGRLHLRSNTHVERV